VSKKSAGIRLVPVEFEIGRKPTTEGAKTPQEFITPGRPRNTKLPGVCDMNFDVVAFLEPKRFDHRDRKANREAVAPFGDLHVTPL
jgi:hypothetical protein